MVARASCLVIDEVKHCWPKEWISAAVSAGILIKTAHGESYEMQPTVTTLDQLETFGRGLLGIYDNEENECGDSADG